jgi:hypothetical protein
MSTETLGETVYIHHTGLGPEVVVPMEQVKMESFCLFQIPILERVEMAAQELRMTSQEPSLHMQQAVEGLYHRHQQQQQEQGALFCWALLQ